MGASTDPIADMLTSVRNALRARHPKVDIPASRVKGEIARVLKEEGFLAAYKVMEENKRKVLRLYRGRPGTKPVLGGLGINIITTPRGIMSGRQARRQSVGGEILMLIPRP